MKNYLQITTPKPSMIINTESTTKIPLHQIQKVDRPDVGHKFPFIAIKIGSHREQGRAERERKIQ